MQAQRWEEEVLLCPEHCGVPGTLHRSSQQPDPSEETAQSGSLPKAIWGGGGNGDAIDMHMNF